jgi:membrane protein YqaA with SNARE-associated domain
VPKVKAFLALRAAQAAAVVAVFYVGAHFAFPEAFQGPDSSCSPGKSTGTWLWQAEFVVRETSWWITLGVLSSVGLGSGMHTGMMFLFPHIMEVVLSAETCGGLRGVPVGYLHPCKGTCDPFGKPTNPSVFWSCVASVYPIAIAWGFGTALGELPPYFIARSARLVGTESEFEQELEDSRKEAEAGAGVGQAFAKMKVWTVNFTQRFGFMGVVMLSAWPNAAFDMCGMACGYLNMPFWSFLGGLILGKAFIKVGGQSVFFCGLFGNGFFEKFIGLVRSLEERLDKGWRIAETLSSKRSDLMRNFKKQQRFFPDVLFAQYKEGLNSTALETMYTAETDVTPVVSRVMKEWDKNKDGTLSLKEIAGAVSKTDGKMSLSSLDPGAPGSFVSVLMKGAWNLLLIIIVVFFAKGIIEHFAQNEEEEEKKSAKKKTK